MDGDRPTDRPTDTAAARAKRLDSIDRHQTSPHAPSGLMHSCGCCAGGGGSGMEGREDSSLLLLKGHILSCVYGWRWGVAARSGLCRCLRLRIRSDRSAAACSCPSFPLDHRGRRLYIYSIPPPCQIEWIQVCRSGFRCRLGRPGLWGVGPTILHDTTTTRTHNTRHISSS
jgi:hypothetical protein